ACAGASLDDCDGGLFSRFAVTGYGAVDDVTAGLEFDFATYRSLGSGEFEAAEPRIVEHQGVGAAGAGELDLDDPGGHSEFFGLVAECGQGSDGEFRHGLSVRLVIPAVGVEEVLRRGAAGAEAFCGRVRQSTSGDCLVDAGLLAEQRDEPGLGVAVA